MNETEIGMKLLVEILCENGEAMGKVEENFISLFMKKRTENKLNTCLKDVVKKIITK